MVGVSKGLEFPGLRKVSRSESNIDAEAGTE